MLLSAGLNLAAFSKGKLVMVAPSFGTGDSMSLLHKQQQSGVPDFMRVPLLMLRRNCQKAMVLIRNWVSQPLLLYTIYWSLMLAATVTVAALSLEMGFSSAISAESCTSPSSCRQCFRLPLDGPRDGFCIPAEWFKNSGMDFAVPPIFAALVVTASALFVQSLGLWSF